MAHRAGEIDASRLDETPDYRLKLPIQRLLFVVIQFVVLLVKVVIVIVLVEVIFL